MSFLSELIVDNGEVIPIEDYALTVEQNSDHNGRPNSTPVAGQFTLTVKSSVHTKDFLGWALSPNQVHSGSITFFKHNAMAVLRKILFTDAYCLKYTEHYTSDGEENMMVNLILSAREIKESDNVHTNNWAKK